MPVFSASESQIAAALFGTALPGEAEGLTAGDRQRIAAFVTATASGRTPGTAAVRVESIEGETATRRMGLAIVNDDMPFLVDSVSAALGQAGLRIERLLHPVIETPEGRISTIYVETGRSGAKARADLVVRLQAVLADVRAATGDWYAMLDALHAARDAVADREAAAFLDWLADDNFTLLGYHAYRFDGDMTAPDFVPLSEGGLGILRQDRPLWRGSEGLEVLPAVRAALATPEPLIISKASVVSTVHRAANLDMVSVKRFDGARVIGERRFVGLFTSQALNFPADRIPLIADKVAAVRAGLGFAPASHAAKALTHVLDTLPKDELFQLGEAALNEMVLGLLSLLDRPRPKLFARRDPFGRFVSVLAFVPRDDYTGGVRESVGAMLAEALGGRVARYEVELRAEGLARVHFLLATDPAVVPVIDMSALDAKLRALVLGWGDRLEGVLATRTTPVRAARLALTHGAAFSAAYRAQFGVEDAAEDALRLAELSDDSERDVRFYRAGDGKLRLKIYRLGEIIALSDAVPVLENFGFRVIEEFAFDLAGGRLGWVHDFTIEGAADFGGLEARVAPALRAVLEGCQENDPFNALVTGAGIDAEQAGWLRAYFRYLRQTGVAYGLQTVVDALARYPEITRGLLELFAERFGPNNGQSADNAILDRLNEVVAIDDDRILRLYRNIIRATLRTNAYAPGGPEALAFKLDSHAVPNLPPPVPYREIWVYSPRVEGIHLRGGPIARGGLRWSDRRDDFRTEVLGLVKAQMVKNAVIVPTGAKGGFYPKQLPPASNRDAWLAEGTESYRVFIRALLSVTDNLDADGKVVPPTHVRCHDAPDPYLVVAADKGTATFSDTANAISEGQGFWLGDAFASGGGVGYDHKAMGITAKGAWISVQRHFREMGVDVQADPVRVIGVGDMSGDVFGNGMLLSGSLKLVAAFDHRHIFLDPDPDAATSFAERTRMFALPRSSWADYDKALISKGGGVFARDLKAIPLSAEVRAMLGVEAAELPPAELMSAILKAEADLIWFGGIGTYVKAAAESHADAGDRANDGIRVDAEELRAKVIGEGANLGVTQAARIAFAARGGRVNTDFIDNSAGVDCSDNEVNIKIALSPEVASGRLSTGDRNTLLVGMTDAVAGLVLRDNIMQTQALSVAERGGAAAMPAWLRVMQALEASGRLNRKVEGLSSDEALTRRAAAGQGLTRPELAVLLAYAKMTLKDALAASALVDDPVLEGDLIAAFPEALATRFPDAVKSHRLRRELIATKIANQLVNRGGIALAFELAEEFGTGLVHVASAFVAARDLFDLRALWRGIDAADVPAATQIALHAEAIGALRAQMSDLLRGTAADAVPGELVASLRPGVGRIADNLDMLLTPEPKAQVDRYVASLAQAGAPADLAGQLGRLAALDGAVGVAQLARAVSADETEAARGYTLLGAALHLDWARGAAAALAPADPWERLLVAGLVRDFETLRLDLLRRVTPAGGSPLTAAQGWLAANAASAARLEASVGAAKKAAPTPAMLAHLAAQARAAMGA